MKSFLIKENIRALSEESRTRWMINDKKRAKQRILRMDVPARMQRKISEKTILSEAFDPPA
jgi:hypothetical protein